MFLEGLRALRGVAHRGVITIDERHSVIARDQVVEVGVGVDEAGRLGAQIVARALIRSRSTSSSGIRPGRSTPDRRLGCIDFGVQQVDRMGRVSSRWSGPKSR